MGKAGGIMSIIAGVLGMLAGVSTLFLGGIGGAFSASGADTIVSFGWFGIASSLLTIVFGGIALAKPRIGGAGSVIVAICGIVLGGTLVAICLALGLIGGVLSVLAVQPADQSGEPAKKRWGTLMGSIVAGCVLAIVGLSGLKPGERSEKNSPDSASGSSPVAQIGQTATSGQFAVTLHSFRLSEVAGRGFGAEQAGPGAIYALLDITVKCVDSESRWYAPGDLFVTHDGRELKFDKQEVILGLNSVVGAINPLTEQRGMVVIKLPKEAAQSKLTWNPGRSFGGLRFTLNPVDVAKPAVAQTATQEGSATASYRSGKSSLELVRQADGSYEFALFAVAENGNTGEAKGRIKLQNALATWKDAANDCELAFRWQAEAIAVEQVGMCGFGFGVEADGSYRQILR